MTRFFFFFFLESCFSALPSGKFLKVEAVHLLAFNEKTGRLADRLPSTRLNAEGNTLSTVTLGHFLQWGSFSFKTLKKFSLLIVLFKCPLRGPHQEGSRTAKTAWTQHTCREETRARKGEQAISKRNNDQKLPGRIEDTNP